MFTRRQGEFFIAQQASLLETDESKALPADILQQQINALQESNPDLTETVSLLDVLNLRTGTPSPVAYSVSNTGLDGPVNILLIPPFLHSPPHLALSSFEAHLCSVFINPFIPCAFSQTK